MKKTMSFALATDDEFLEALRAEDPLGAVVRAHIHIEARLNLVLEALTPDPKHLPSLRFEQRAKLAVALGLDESILTALSELGRIRNAFAHRLDVTLTDDMVDRLFAAFSADDQKTIVDAYQRTQSQLKMDGMLPYDQTDARHKFITMAVAIDRFLLVAEVKRRRSRTAEFDA